MRTSITTKNNLPLRASHFTGTLKTRTTSTSTTQTSRASSNRLKAETSTSTASMTFLELKGPKPIPRANGKNMNKRDNNNPNTKEKSSKTSIKAPTITPTSEARARPQVRSTQRTLNSAESIVASHRDTKRPLSTSIVTGKGSSETVLKPNQTHSADTRPDKNTASTSQVRILSSTRKIVATTKRTSKAAGKSSQVVSS